MSLGRRILPSWHFCRLPEGVIDSDTSVTSLSCRSRRIYNFPSFLKFQTNSFRALGSNQRSCSTISKCPHKVNKWPKCLIPVSFIWVFQFWWTKISTQDASKQNTDSYLKTEKQGKILFQPQLDSELKHPHLGLTFLQLPGMPPWILASFSNFICWHKNFQAHTSFCKVP